MSEETEKVAATERRRVFVMGLDGATFDLIHPWVAAGELPHLAALLREGAWGELESTIPPISAPAWTSFMTGVNPGKHGIYHFQEHLSNTYRARLTNGADVKAPTLWRLLSDAGKTAISINVAMTFPPEPVQGIVISGVEAPGTGCQYTHPAELAAELERVIGKYVIEPGLVEHCRRGRYDLAYEALAFATEQRIKAVEYLMAEKPWDLFVVNYRATDNVQHHFWHHMDATHPVHDSEQAKQYSDCILRVYRRLDEWLGVLRQRLDADTTLVVMSDHGAGPASAKAIYLNRWLEREGWLTFAGQKAADLSGRTQAALRQALWKAIWGPLRRLVSKPLKDAVRRLAPRLYDRARTPASYFAIDWPHTRVYSDEFREAIWVNLKGREPQGVVEPGEECEALLAQVTERAYALTDPQTGQSVVERVYRREELYHGEQAALAPDLTLVLRQEPYVRTRLSHTSRSTEPVQTLTRSQLLADFLPPGLHRSNGILLLGGAGVRPGGPLAGAGIIDVAPTILHLLRLPVPRHMDGRVLQEALADAAPVTFADYDTGGWADRQGYSAEEEADVREKLAGLGYLG